MGINGVFSYSFDGEYRPTFNFGAYLNFMASSYLNATSYNPGFIWGAKRYIGAMNTYNLFAAGSYGRVTRYPGSGPYYSVVDASSYPLVFSGASSRGDFARSQMAIASDASVKLYSQQIAGEWSKVRSLGAFLDSKYLSDESKATIKSYVEQAKNALKTLDKYLKNEDGLSSAQLNKILSEKLAEAREVVQETDELYEDLQVEIKEREEEIGDAALEGLDDGSSTGSSSSSPTSASGSVTGEKVDKLSEDEQDENVSKSRYGMNPTASVQPCDNASDLAGKAVAEDMTTKDKFTGLFGREKDINKGNIIEVLGAMTSISGFVDKIAELKNNENDYSEKALNEIAKLLQQRVNLLVAAGHLDSISKIDVDGCIDKLNMYASNVSGNKDAIVTQLGKIVTLLKDKGTEAVVTEEFEAKKTEAIELGYKEFREAVAKASGKELDEGKTYEDFPDSIKYLPNKKLFQVTISAGGNAYYFEAGNFNNLNVAIVAELEKFSDTGIAQEFVTNWNTIKENLLKEKTDEAT